MNIEIIIVLYNQKIESTSTYKTLMKNKEIFLEGGIDYHIDIYDNSLISQAGHIEETGKIEYKHDPRNLGLANAYNHALSKAIQNKAEWLLLLDQDTILNKTYFNELVRQLKKNIDCVAILPQILSDDYIVSPILKSKSNNLRFKKNNPKLSGIQNSRIQAINSGAVIRVGFLNVIGGFSEDFPLDYLDHWLFFELFKLNKKVFVLDSIINHSLSVMDFNRVSIERYHSILDSEFKFYKEYDSSNWGRYKKHLLLRFLKQMLKMKNKKLAFYTLKKWAEN